MDNIVRVGMADLNIVKHSGIITTLGLGSCVGIVLYDPIVKIGGLAHIMLPYSSQVKNNSNKAKFADTGTVELLKMMISAGAKKEHLVAKLAGGAQMFAFTQAVDLMNIGERNILASREVLKSLNIPIIAEDTGKNYGRTIELYTEDGSLHIKSVGHGIKTI